MQSSVYECQSGNRQYLVGSTVVDRLSPHPKVEGSTSNPDTTAATGREKITIKSSLY